MDDDRAQARLALSLVEGMLRGDAAADRLVIDTFDDLEQAARAHAHLSGFLLQVLAEARHETPAASAHVIRSLLDR